MNKFGRVLFVGLLVVCFVQQSFAAVAGRRMRTRARISTASANQTVINGPASRLAEDMQALGLSDPIADLNSFGLDEQQGADAGNALSPIPDYEDALFDDYGESSSVTDRFLSSEICGKKYFCRKGDRGPCRPNEIFLPQSNVSSIIRPSCSGLVSSPWNGCYPAGKVKITTASNVASGYCSLRFPSRPCFGYPPGYRYSKQTKRCYPCSSQSKWGGGLVISGPCPPNKIFIDIDGVNGMCRCRDSNHLLYKNDEHCYRIYSRGPCLESQWLEPYSNGYGVCRKSPCPNNMCDGRHIYWRPTPTSRGGCYKSFTRGPCKHGSYFLIEDYGTRRGRCVSRYGSSYNPISSFNSYGMSNNRFGGGYGSSSNRLSMWSNFGMYPPYGMGMMQDYFDDFSDDAMGLDYDMF